jgi:DNA-binding MarR family transcriptional regulator
MTTKTMAQASADASTTARFLDEYLPYWLAQASYWISSEFHREVAEAGLTVAEWRVLASLHGNSGETIGALCRLALLKQPTLSKLVQRLEAEDLVARRDTDGDRRQTIVTSTAKGQARVAALVAKARVHQQEVLKPFGENNSRDLIRTLKDLVRQHEHTGLFDSK